MVKCQLDKLKYKAWRYYRLLFKPIFLEIHVAHHCNLNCVSCTHYSPISESKYLEATGLRNDLIDLKRNGIIPFFKEIRLMGGEPLLNPDIETIIKTSRELLNDKKIIIVTNGTLLSKMPDSFFMTCRENKITIAITLYPVKIDVDEIEKKMCEHKVKFILYGDRTGNAAFKQTLVRTDKKTELKKNNFMECFDKACFQLYDGKLFSCPQSAYKETLNTSFGTHFQHASGDYLNLKDINRRRFLKYLFSSKPFCSYCVFPQKQIDWKISSKLESEWILGEMNGADATNK